MIRYIDSHRGQFRVEPICKVLPIAPATYYEHKALECDPDRRSDRAKRDERLMPEIERVWKENFEVYGVKKVWRQMRREDFAIALCTVGRLMKRLGLEGVTRGRKKYWTTIVDDSQARPADLVNREFSATRPNQLWVADITFVATWCGFVHVAFVIDVLARMFVGWHVSRSLKTDLVLDGLEQALWSRTKPASRSTTVTAAANICRSITPNDWPRPKSSHRSAVSAILTAMRWPKRSTACTKPKSSANADPGKISTRSSTPPWMGGLV